MNPSAWDFVVVGGGPAGMSAALVASLNGVETLLLERAERFGGQIRWADAPVPDLLGCWAEDGEALADRFAAHLARAPARTRTGAVASVRAVGKVLRLTLEAGEELTARRVLLATGLRPRVLGVPGEALADQAPAPRRALERFADRPVAVVGGGDEAASLARDLARAGARVTLLVRSRMRARPAFADPVRRHESVEIREPAVVERLEGTADLETVVLTSGERLAMDFCFVRIGVEPAPPTVRPPLERHDDGRVVVDGELRTSCPGVFAAGDLVRPRGEHYVAAALADGAIVGRRVEGDLAGR